MSALDDLVATVLDDPRAGVAVGTYGAIAEFARTGPATVEHRAPRHLVRAADGAARIVARPDVVARAWRRPTGAGTSWSHGVALCLPTEAAAGPARDVVTELGPDADALDDPDREAPLFDLGLGVGHLEACVRTTDPGLLDALRAGEGRALDGDLSGALVETGPPRVFRSAVARIEVRTPIPPPQGTSPTGPHTHLLPALLAHRRTHAATDPIPDGHVPVAHLFPAHPSHDLLGREHPYDAAADAAFDSVLARFGDPAEVAATETVRRGVRAGVPPRTPPTDDRAARRGWEVALRSLELAGQTGPSWRAWRDAAATRRDLDEAPFHEQH